MSMLNDDLHLKFGKKFMQNVVYMGNEKNLSLLLLLRFLMLCFFFFVLFFHFFGTVVSETRPSTNLTFKSAQYIWSVWNSNSMHFSSSEVVR